MHACRDVAYDAECVGVQGYKFHPRRRASADIEGKNRKARVRAAPISAEFFFEAAGFAPKARKIFAAYFARRRREKSAGVRFVQSFP